MKYKDLSFFGLPLFILAIIIDVWDGNSIMKYTHNLFVVMLILLSGLVMGKGINEN